MKKVVTVKFQNDKYDSFYAKTYAYFTDIEDIEVS